MEKMLTVAELQKRTGIRSKTTIYHWVKMGYLHPVKIESKKGKPLMFDIQEVEQFISSNIYRSGRDMDGIFPMFQAVPNVEECWPMNLILVVRNMADEPEDAPLRDVWNVDIRKFLTLVSRLTDREQKIIHLRFQYGLTLDAVGRIFGVTRERVRLIQNKALRKLCHNMAYNNCFVVDAATYDEMKAQVIRLEARCAELEKAMADIYTTQPEIVEDKNDMAILMNTMLEELDWSVRAYNCLKRAGFHTVGDLIRFDQVQHTDANSFLYKDWKSVRNLGRKSLLEIAKVIYDFCGYRIRYVEYDRDDAITAYYNIPVPYADDTLHDTLKEETANE